MGCWTIGLLSTLFYYSDAIDYFEGESETFSDSFITSIIPSALLIVWPVYWCSNIKKHKLSRRRKTYSFIFCGKQYY